jgi:GNAT superfamily N-acetyltransferase
VVTIRPFRATDQVAARALIEDGLGEHFGRIDRDANPDLVDIAASYSAGTGAFFVAELDDNVVGTTGLIVEGQVGRLVRVAVARSHRRAGVATALLEHIANFAARAGVAELIAYTQPEWPDATAFYRSHGFTPFGRDEIDIHLRRIVEPDGVGRCSAPVTAEAGQ